MDTKLGAENTFKTPPILHTPVAGEFDCLAVLWQAHADGEQALKMSEVHRRICQRREKAGEPLPALTTVSTQLRSLVTKGLLQEVVIEAGEEASLAPKVRSRGLLTPPSRSPRTGYRTAFPPSLVLHDTFRGFGELYPTQERHQALLDFGRAIGLDQATLTKVEGVLKSSRFTGPRK